MGLRDKNCETFFDGKDCIVMTSILNPGTESAYESDDIHVYRVPDCKSKRQAVAIVFEYGGGDYEGVHNPAIHKCIVKGE